MTHYDGSAEAEAAIRTLVAEHPILRPIFDEHVRDNDGVLGHVVMPEFAQFLGRLVAEQSDEPAATREVEAIIRTLDAQFQQGGYWVKNVIAVSFLEQLPSTGEPGTEIRERLPPALRNVFDEVNW